MSVDRTPIGDQFVIPGAERVGDGELAKRKAEQRLQPAKPQKPCDHGLFSDAAAQVDLMDLLRK